MSFQFRVSVSFFLQEVFWTANDKQEELLPLKSYKDLIFLVSWTAFSDYSESELLSVE